MANLKDVAFGIELEYAHIGFNDAARAIASVTGGTITRSRYGSLRVSDDKGRQWAVVTDTSISPHGCETVSPILAYDDIELLQNIVRALRRAGAKANTSTGIHVHVSHPDLDVKGVRNMINWTYRQGDHLNAMVATHADRKLYCTDTSETVVERFKSRPKNKAAAAHAWYGPHNSYRNPHNWGTYNHRYDHSRYNLLNCNSWFFRGSIEWRMFNSITHAGKVKAYIQLCLAVTAQCISKNGSQTAKRTIDGSPAYACRCVLLRLGLKGAEYKTARLHLTSHLPGPCDKKAWDGAIAA